MLELQRMKLDLAELSLGTNESKAADQMRLRLEVSHHEHNLIRVLILRQKLRGVFK